MRLIYVLVLSTVAGISCQKSSGEKSSFQSTKLSVGVEELNSSLSLNAESQAAPPFVTKADLWCNNKFVSSLEFGPEQQSVELYSSLENCELRLIEFVNVVEYTIGNLFSEGIYEFNIKDPGTSRFADKRLVRSIQAISDVSEEKCKAACALKEINVKFLHSILEFKNEILVGDINVNELNALIEKEDAPSCESLSGRFIESGSSNTPPSLEIVLKNCTNTIGTGELEFGFGPVTLDKFGQLPSPIDITNVMGAIDNFPIIPAKDGNNYTIRLSFEQLKALFGEIQVSTIEILTFDFAVAIRNKQGISGLIYLIDNQCKAKVSGL